MHLCHRVIHGRCFVPFALKTTLVDVAAQSVISVVKAPNHSRAVVVAAPDKFVKFV